MCGIVGYVGPKEAVDFLIEGLRRLEYRGYDSSGVVTIDDGDGFNDHEDGRPDRRAGSQAEEVAGARPHRPRPHAVGDARPGHRRQRPSALRRQRRRGDRAQRRDREFPRAQAAARSKTATNSRRRPTPKSIAHLIAEELEDAAPASATIAVDPYAPLIEAVQAALAQLRGTYGLAIMFRDWPDVIVAARLRQPAGDRHRQGRALHRQRRLAAGRPHRQDRLSGRQRDWPWSPTDAIRVMHRDDGHVDHDVKRARDRSRRRSSWPAIRTTCSRRSSSSRRRC